MLAIRKCAKDSSAYVRKTAAHAIPKVYRRVRPSLHPLVAARRPPHAGSVEHAANKLCLGYT